MAGRQGNGPRGWNRVAMSPRCMPGTGPGVLSTMSLNPHDNICHDSQFTGFTGKAPRLGEASISLPGEETALLAQTHLP